MTRRAVNDTYIVASGEDLWAGRAASPAPAPPPPPPGPPPPPPPAPSITLSSTGAATAGSAYAVTVTAANLTGPLTVTPERVSGPSVTFDPTTVLPAPGELVKLFNLTAAAAGTLRVRATAAGGIVSNELDVTVNAAPAPGPTPPPPPPPPPATGAMQLTLASSQSGALPFASGFAFRQGDIPAGQGIAVSGATAQATIQSAWPDGSARMAVIAGSYTSAGSPVTVTLSAGTASSGTALTTADLQAALTQPVTITAGAFGSASWSGADWASQFATWVSGHRMSSWIYRKPVGSDAHLVAWLEVRLYAGGAVEILPWLENGYLTVAGAGTKSARLTFTMGGTLRYDSINDPDFTGPYGTTVVASGVVNIAAQCRAALVSGGAMSHWLGTNPGVTPAPDLAYLAETKMVPAYRPASIAEPTLAGLTQAYRPMRLAYLEGGMGSPGYDAGIGLLPNHAAMYLVSGDARARQAVIAQGLSLGSYCIHYRDQATNRPILFASHPNKSTNTGSDVIPTPSGSAPYAYAQSHHPAAAYLPFLLTGWHWFAEEIQFQTTLHYLASVPAARQSANYFLHPSAAHFGSNNQGGPRAIAWQWRTLAMAAAVTPDADTAQKSQFVGALHYNAQAYRQIHETGTWAGGLSWAPNNLGLSWEPGFPSVDADGQVVSGVWQDDFLTASVGLCWDLDVITDTARKNDLRWFRDFKYRAVVGRLGNQNDTDEWNFRDAAPYQMKIGTPGGGGTTMSWYASWGAAYAAANQTRSGPAGANTGQTGNDLRGGNIESNGMSQSYWANLQAAIAYAVDHGALGAVAAYNRMIEASNWASTSAEFATTPGWGVRPRTSTVIPAAGFALAIETVGAGGSNTGYQSVRPAPFTWNEFSRTLGTSFGSGIFAEQYSSKGAYVFAGTGGHAHPDMVDAIGFDFTTRTWFHLPNANGVPNVGTGGFTTSTATTSPWFEAVAGSPATVPAPPHVYSCHVYVPPANGGGTKGSFAFGVRHAVAAGASASSTAHRMDLNTRVWSRMVSADGDALINGLGAAEGRCVFDPVTSRIYLIAQNYHNFNFVPFVNTASVTPYGNLGTFSPPPDFGSDGCTSYPGAVFDPVRRLIIRTLQRKLRALDLNNVAAGWQLLTLTNATLLPNETLGASEVCYHAGKDAFYWLPSTGGSTLYKITPPSSSPISNPWVVSTQTIGGDTIHVHGNDGINGQGSGAYKSLMYVPSDDVLAWCAVGQNGSGGNLIRPMTYINPVN